MQSCSQVINTQLFTGLMPFLSPNRQCQSMLDKKIRNVVNSSCCEKIKKITGGI